jgi:F420-non-reducing hydrogenase small subunit
MLEPRKARFAMYWAAGCGGCEIAVLNIHERLLAFDAHFEVIFWPVAMDAKEADVEALPDGYIDLCLFNGAIRSDHNEAMARLLRRKSALLVSFGACASQGGIPALANLSATSALVDTAFSTLSTQKSSQSPPRTLYASPEGNLHLPALLDSVRTLEQVVPVDYTLPGCPPESAQIAAVIQLVIAALEGQATLPPPGSVIGAGASSVCDECGRQRSEKSIGAFRRMATYQPDPNTCLLEQGLVCAGPATRSGCQACCPAANVPCSGCYGPADPGAEQGARLLSAIASLVAGKTHAEMAPIMDGIPDPLGSFYRYSLASSILHRAKPQSKERNP